MAGQADGKPKPLIGQEEAVLDDKGRLLFSKKKRERLGEEVVMCQGDKGCIEVFSQADWDATVERVMDYDRANEARDMFLREVLGTAQDEIGFDPQGRTVIPRSLREMANLRDVAMLVGCGDRVEIWAIQEWVRYQEDPKGYGGKRAALLHETRVGLRDERWGGYDRIPR